MQCHIYNKVDIGKAYMYTFLQILSQYIIEADQRRQNTLYIWMHHFKSVVCKIIQIYKIKCNIVFLFVVTNKSCEAGSVYVTVIYINVLYALVTWIKIYNTILSISNVILIHNKVDINMANLLLYNYIIYMSTESDTIFQVHSYKLISNAQTTQSKAQITK